MKSVAGLTPRLAAETDGMLYRLCDSHSGGGLRGDCSMARGELGGGGCLRASSGEVPCGRQREAATARALGERERRDSPALGASTTHEVTL